MILTQMDMSFYWWFLVGIVAGCGLLCVLAAVLGALAAVVSILWDELHGA